MLGGMRVSRLGVRVCSGLQSLQIRSIEPQVLQSSERVGSRRCGVLPHIRKSLGSRLRSTPAGVGWGKSDGACSLLSQLPRYSNYSRTSRQARESSSIPWGQTQTLEPRPSLVPPRLIGLLACRLLRLPVLYRQLARHCCTSSCLSALHSEEESHSHRPHPRSYQPRPFNMTIPLDKPDPILLTLFANRFMSVAEAAGRALQLTSIVSPPLHSGHPQGDQTLTPDVNCSPPTSKSVSTTRAPSLPRTET